MPELRDPLPRLLEWMREHLDQPLPLAVLAGQVHMSPRTFARRFSALTGTTPHRWRTRERLLVVPRMLESTDEPSQRIARQAGFTSASTMRALFRQFVGMPPEQYRARFRSSRSAPTEQAR